MKKLYPVLVALFALAASGCAPKVDVEAERTALLDTDTALAEAKAANDVAQVTSYYADDASIFPPNGPSVNGKEAYGPFLSQLFAIPGFALSWQPKKAEVSRTGDLGYTLGAYELTMNDAEGNPLTDRGKYVTVWKKQADGTWKVVATIWNSDQPAPGAASE